VKLLLTGFSNSGKTTVFNALTGLNLLTTPYPTIISAGVEPHHGVVKIPDYRLDKLSSIYKPRKTTYAAVEYIDYAGITLGGNASQNTKVFDLIKDADAIVHVVRAFKDESVSHPMGSIDPIRDVKSFETELILGDLEFIEKRLQKIEEQAKRGKKQDEADRHLLLKCKKALENEVSIRNIVFTDEEKRLMLPYQFLSKMPLIIVLNIDEKDINSKIVRDIQNEIEAHFRKIEQSVTPPVLLLCGKIEMEIAQLPQDEANAFLEDLGIKEPAMNMLCRVSYETLGLISFFTVVEDEVKAWTIKKGTEAVKAAGKIHSDIEKGFIRAEVINYEDFISSGEDMVNAKKHGLLRLEGKNYIVQDGDIINFKFNV